MKFIFCIIALISLNTFAQSDDSVSDQPKNPVELQREQAQKHGVKDQDSNLFGFYRELQRRIR